MDNFTFLFGVNGQRGKKLGSLSKADKHLATTYHEQSQPDVMLGTQALRRVLRHANIRKWQSRRSYTGNSIQHNASKRPSIAYVRPINSRGLATTTVPSILVPPLMFLGLLVGLWTWKCFWIIVMQNKLLYLTWLPPFTRSELISDYQGECRPVQWEEKQIRSLDGTKLAICEGRIPVDASKNQKQVPGSPRKKSVVICYFQGNGGSTPMRLPLLSQVLHTVSEMKASSSSHFSEDTQYSIVALSYRGYWKSAGRATQRGLEMDAQACLNWVSRTYGDPQTDLEIVIWGHSLGAAVAASAVSTYVAQQDQEQISCETPGDGSLAPVTKLILEAPTSSIKDMLISLYPQKWLPYRYLWPFSWNNWDIKNSLRQMATWRDRNEDISNISKGRDFKPEANRSSLIPSIFLLSAEKDEVIPSYVPGEIEEQAKSLALPIQIKNVLGAMHTEAPAKLDGRKALVGFILTGSSSPERVQSK